MKKIDPNDYRTKGRAGAGRPALGSVVSVRDKVTNVSSGMDPDAGLSSKFDLAFSKNGKWLVIVPNPDGDFTPVSNNGSGHKFSFVGMKDIVGLGRHEVKKVPRSKYWGIEIPEGEKR